MINLPFQEPILYVNFWKFIHISRTHATVQAGNKKLLSYIAVGLSAGIEQGIDPIMKVIDPNKAYGWDNAPGMLLIKTQRSRKIGN